jgi:hypothetical protein
MAGGVRSEVLFTILERLQAAQVPMAASTAEPATGRVAPSAPAPPPQPPLLGSATD